MNDYDGLSLWDGLWVLVACAILGGGIWGIVAICDSAHEAGTHCRALHHDKPYQVESSFAVTEGGCHVMRIERFNEHCWSDGYVYITDCRGAAWDERVGKSLVRRATTNP